MSDCYESTSRTPIRDVPSNQPRCRHSTGGTCRIADRWPKAERENVVRSKTSRGEGLVPRWGRGGAWQNPPCRLAVPSHNSGFSHLGAPATAGMCDCCYENGLPPLNSSFVRKHVPDSDPGCALQSTSMPALHRRNVPNCRPMVDGGMRKCSAGACPQLRAPLVRPRRTARLSAPLHAVSFTSSPHSLHISLANPS